MKTVKVKIDANIQFICTDCGQLNRYSIIGMEPKVVVCKCGEKFAPEIRADK